ncbi:MAG: hypothetical protein RL607_1295 [Bacteroidota bacterium]|jgi:hypothetical protein
MNLNILGYLVYLLLTAWIILWVGHQLYRNGIVFVNHLYPHHESLCLQTNKILLTGYYLVNLGYATLTLSQWETIVNSTQLIETIAYRTAIILSILTVLHYGNLITLSLYFKKQL